MQAQKLIVDHISSIEFKHWCPKKLHQVVVRKDAGYTAKVERSARNRSDRNVRLDVAVYKDNEFAFAVEVTHTHRVSAASREGIPYVDVNAAETVRRLQAGETTLLCESASGVPHCVACLTEDIKVKLENFKCLLKCAHWHWRIKKQKAFDKLAAGKLAEKERERKGRLGMWREDCLAHAVRDKKMRRRRDIQEKCLTKCQNAWLDCVRRAFVRLHQHADEWQRVDREAKEKEKRRLEEQRESNTKKNRARTFWGTFMQHSGAAQSKTFEKTAASAAPKRHRVWESDKKREERYRIEHWEKLSSGSSAQELQSERVCQACKNTRAVLVKHSPNVNGGYAYRAQCTTCLQRMLDEGFGDGVAFSREDDEIICKLLNAYGEPMFEGYAMSRMHFHRSALAFHDAFRHKTWEALVDHIRRNFTTTMSMPNVAMPGYRGWYTKLAHVAL